MFPKFRRETYLKLIIFGIVGILYYSINLHNQIQHMERVILNDLAKQIPGFGDNGDPVSLEGEANITGENDMKVVGMNVELSNHLSYNRVTPDIRNPLCRDIEYDMDSLPTASVVIIFHNEPYSLLLRTVHSVLRTTDPRNLKEIILVDDASTNDDLLDKLDYYVSTRLPQYIVKIIRMKDRSGLIRARLAGAREASADVLVFLDAHCECVVNWLEPLLERIQESPTSVVLPIVDIIQNKDFQFVPYIADNKKFLIGGFVTQANFFWIDIPERELSRQKNECSKELEICPTHSPVMIGGLFAIAKVYFWESGSYDEQMTGWGGENMEMSFRIWQCGGTVEVIPCSRVGHVFRKVRPYSVPDDSEGINIVRMALAWMDEYKYIMYLKWPELKNNPKIGNLTDRLSLRKNLQCKNFEWYIQNIYPEKPDLIINVVGYGRFAAISSDLCLDNFKENYSPYDLGVDACNKPDVTLSQFYSLTNEGFLRTDFFCASVKIGESPPYKVGMIVSIHDADCEKWNYSESQIRHLNTNMCLDHEGLTNKDHIVVRDCDPNKISQKWRIEP